MSDLFSLDDLEYRHKRPSEEFEQAVVRLLNVLSIPTVWYGKTVDDRADALGILQSDKTTLLLIECTREKPIEKFSTLAERASHLRKFLPIKADVLPVVFTAARIVESEAAAAVEYGLGLVGAEEIQHLLGLISTPGTTGARILDCIRPRETVADQILRTVSECLTADSRRITFCVEGCLPSLTHCGPAGRVSSVIE